MLYIFPYFRSESFFQLFFKYRKHGCRAKKCTESKKDAAKIIHEFEEIIRLQMLLMLSNECQRFLICIVFKNKEQMDENCTE